MTAIKKFRRLESKAVWIENSDIPPRSVIISFGKSSIIISNENALPLDHWNFNSILVISKNKENTIFSQGANTSEKLIIEDEEMINAIILICNTKNQHNKPIFRIRKLLKYFSFILLSLLIFYFPYFLREILIKVTEPKNELIYYNQNFNKFISKYEICSKSMNIENIERKINEIISTENFITITVFKYGIDNPLLLPGGNIIIPFNWLKGENSFRIFKDLIEVAVGVYKERYVFKNFLKEQSLIKILSFIFKIEIYFDLKIDNYNWEYFKERRISDQNIFISEEEWINLRNICYN